MKRYFAQRLGGLHHDEEGTTITEFVLLLPVFITIFAGMLNLSRLQHNSVEAHVSASKMIWDQAIPVQKDDVSSGYTSYSEAQNRSAQNLAQRTDQPHNNLRSFLTNRWNESGTLGDSMYMIDETYNSYLKLGNDQETEFDLNQYHRMGSSGAMKRLLQLESEGNSDLRLEMTDNINPLVSTPMARLMLDDSINSPVSTTPRVNKLLDASSQIAGQSGSRMAIGAGIRYGNVGVTVSRDANVAGIDFELDANYDMLVAPVAYELQNQQIRTIGVSRLGMEAHTLYSTTPGIEGAETLRYNSSY
ncbi:MAG: TadE family protein [Myxococcota bacterium]|nr:TadE family protein [Myxococcota bacterium]